MNITILNKAHVPTGPFTREQIEQKLRSGECTANDLAFVEGLSEWTPLGKILAMSASAPGGYPPAIPVPSSEFRGYAGFWLRVVAYIIDRLIVGIPLLILNAVEDAVLASMHPGQNLKMVSSSGGINYPFVELFIFQMIVGILIYWLYFALQESSSFQATIGKRLLGLKVTDVTGRRIGFGQATGRFFGKIVSGAILCIGFMMAGFTERKQALHDMLAGTLVTKG